MILISAGHYPERPGACYKQFCEHGEANLWAILIVDELTHLGHITERVPSGTLRDKTEFINSRDADMAVEIHFNSAITIKGDHIGKGSETLYYPGSEKGALLANNIQDELGKVFTPDRGIKEGWYRMDKARGADYFLKKTNCTSVIIEPDFIHRDNHIIINRNDGCKSITKAIIKTLDELMR